MQQLSIDRRRPAMSGARNLLLALAALAFAGGQGHDAIADSNAFDAAAFQRRILPTGDYSIRSTTQHRLEVLMMADVESALRASRASRAPAESRPTVALLARHADARVKSLLPQMQEETEDDVQDYSMQLRSGARWRVVTTSAADNYPILDTAFDGERVVRTGSRQRNGERMAVYEAYDPMYLSVGPLQVLDVIAACGTLTRHAAARSPEGGSAWKLSIASLDEEVYDLLRLPVLWVGAGRGTVTVRQTATTLTFKVLDAHGAPVVLRRVETQDGIFHRFVEEQWLPGHASLGPAQQLTLDVRAFARTGGSKDVYPSGYWHNTRIVDMRGGRARQVLSPHGLLPDATFDRLWSASNRPAPEQAAGSWVLPVLAVALVLLGLLGRRLSTPNRPTSS